MIYAAIGNCFAADVVNLITKYGFNVKPPLCLGDG
jgi:hypothetical protein